MDEPSSFNHTARLEGRQVRATAVPNSRPLGHIQLDSTESTDFLLGKGYPHVVEQRLHVAKNVARGLPKSSQRHAKPIRSGG